MFDHILARIAGPHNDLIYIGKNYTLADLERDLRLRSAPTLPKQLGPVGSPLNSGCTSQPSLDGCGPTDPGTPPPPRTRRKPAAP